MINKLSSKLINQIAAGEVVDNPSSVIKELIENSIDAESSIIKIYLEKGGIEKITIEDDGIGIEKKQLNKAFERHATSKISKIEDLSNINTLGFRGEALPSIASVSRIKIQSKSKNNNKGYELKVNSGKYSKIIPSNIEYGTIIEVKDLFFNVPARKKFLKSESAEYRKILKIFKNIALSNYNISFELFNNSKSVYKFKKESLLDRINSIFGSVYSENCIKVEYRKDKYKISGYIGSLSIIKSRPGNQYLFINNRPVKNQLINLSVYNAYRSLINRNEYPSFYLFLDVPAESLDVNVHPKKNEVKFDNELQIQYIFKKSVSDALKNISKVIPDFSKNEDFEKIEEGILEFSNTSNLKSDIISINSNDQSEFNVKRAELRINNFPSSNKVDIESKNIWQIHNKYIITEIKSGLIIIDQHVAHERVLYETALKALEGDNLPSQAILFPKTIEFEPEEYTYAIELFYYLKKIGFKYRSFGENSIIIEGVPSDLEFGREADVIKDILEKYMKTKKASSSFIDYIAATYACKAAVKAGDKLSEIECKELIDQLFATDHPYYCPHGRPIIVNLGIDDIDKRFERH